MAADPSDRKKNHQSWLDRQIHELIGDGDVSHLPNAGRKFDWSKESPHTPDDMRLAYKIMHDSDVLPEWIGLGRELEAQQEKIDYLAQRFYVDYMNRRTDGEHRNSFLMLRDAETRWDAAQKRLRDLIEEYNRKLLTFNIVRPTQIAQRVPIVFDEVMRRAIQTD